jgi:hypothetical protein
MLLDSPGKRMGWSPIVSATSAGGAIPNLRLALTAMLPNIAGLVLSFGMGLVRSPPRV